MILPILAIVFGLPLLIWSAERFIHGASHTAAHFGISPLLIGILIIGFGTSAPEIIVSIIAALQGNGGLAIGNVVGSNITNIALVGGVTALLSPIVVKSSIVRKELPVLLAVTMLALWLLSDLSLSFYDALCLIGIFVVLVFFTIWHANKVPKDKLNDSVSASLEQLGAPIKPYLIWLVSGLVLLIVSSRILVWGAVEIAYFFEVSNVIIGLTIVGIGTSLPELISCVIAVRKQEHEMAIGNIVGSNLFNILAVMGISGLIESVQVDQLFVYRDGTIMLGLTILLLVFCFGRQGSEKINRIEGGALLLSFVAYLYLLISTEFM